MAGGSMIRLRPHSFAWTGMTGAATTEREAAGMRRHIGIILAAAALSASACTGHSQQTSAPHPIIQKNPTDFPLVAGSSVIDVKPFSQTIPAASAKDSALSASGAGTYSGTEVLAESGASDASLRAWLTRLKTAPPPGYAYQPASTDEVQRALDRFDVAYAAFVKTSSPTPHGVVLVVMDPQLVRAKIGIAADLVQRYRDLPESMRQPIDDQLKKQIGFSATEATDPSAPLGATLAALQELGSTDTRAIIEIDATKH
jgi:hypothetical protein